MSSYKCNFCDNNYGSKKSLTLHQKTAKFCLEIQKGMENHTNVHDIENIYFTCDYCDDKFTLKSSLERHYEKCKIRQEKIREENEQKKNDEILELKRIIEMQSKPSLSKDEQEKLDQYESNCAEITEILKGKPFVHFENESYDIIKPLKITNV